MHKFLGQTKIKIFPIGFGTGFSDIEYKSPRLIIKILNLAIDSGINLIDTAESYGDEQSEKLISKVIKNKRSKVILATKFSPENSSYKNLVKSCENSLKRLKTDYIDLYQFHWPDPKTPFEESIKALEKLKKDGKIKYFGAGNFSKEELEKLLMLTNPKNVVSIQTEFNLNEPYIKTSGLLNFCTKNNLNIISYSPLDQGRTKDITKNQKKMMNYLTKKYVKTTSQIILNWEVNKKPVIPIPKTLNQIHLLENIDSLDFKMTQKEYLEIDEMFSPKVHMIKISDIQISQKGERGRGGYQTLAEALENNMNLVPGPNDLAQNLESSTSFKPVKLIRQKGNKKYFLINGRVRFWAWVIKYGTQKPIPSYIRNH